MTTWSKDPDETPPELYVIPGDVDDWDDPEDDAITGDVVDGPEDADEWDDWEDPEPSALALHVGYVVAGGSSLLRRRAQARKERPTAVHAAAMRQALASGDHQTAFAWDDRRFRENQAHRQRVFDRWDAWTAPLRAVCAGVVWMIANLKAVGVALLALWILVAFATHDPLAFPNILAAVVNACAAVFTALAAVAAFVAAVWWLLTACGSVALLWWLHREGQQAWDGYGVPWSVAGPRAQVESGAVVDESAIVSALSHLGISAMNKAVKAGWSPVFVLPPVRDGNGYHAVLSLPPGATAAMVSDRCDVLAHNLHRSPVEVWPVCADTANTGQAGQLDVWVADPGSLSRPVPPYPLLDDGTADVFAGVPVGVTQRGDVLSVPLVENNVVIGGIPGMGKSNAVRVLMLGAALDPLAVLEVFVFALNGDFDAYAPRLAGYSKGLDDDQIHAAMDRLDGLLAEVARREGRLSELGAKKVTRALAERHPDLRPLVVAFSECHELFGHPDKAIRERAGEVAVRVIKRGRKTGVILIFDTQDARADAIPPALVSQVSVNACLRVKTHTANDGFLGAGSYRAGIRATALRKSDRGVSVTTGVTENASELLRWFYVEEDADTGYDAAEAVIARSLGLVKAGTPVGGPERAALPESRDLLADVLAVLAGERKTAARTAVLLEELDGRTYRGLDGVRLTGLLAEQGARVIRPKGVVTVDPKDVQQAVSERERGGPLDD